MFPGKKEVADRRSILENRIIYSLPVRLGFWNDDLAIIEDVNTINAYKKDNCQLLTQKIRKLFRNLLQPMTLSTTLYVGYNANYQIESADIKVHLNNSNKLYNNLVLSGLVTEQEIDVTQHFCHGCIVTASNIKQPCVRNTFKIVGTTPEQNGTVLFGEPIYLQISESGNRPLYLQYENNNIANFGTTPVLRLSQFPDVYCRFKFYYWNPLRRDELAGSYNSFHPLERVIIRHCASGHNLNLEEQKRMPTFFGPECEVNCKTKRDTHRMELPSNFWRLIPTIGSNKNLMVRAAKGEKISEEYL